MLNDTTKPAEVLHKGGFDLLTLLHRRDVELQAHVTFGAAMTISNVASISTMGLSRAPVVIETSYSMRDRMTSKVSVAETDCEFRRPKPGLSSATKETTCVTSPHEPAEGLATGRHTWTTRPSDHSQGPNCYWYRMPVYDSHGNMVGWRGRPVAFCS